MLRRCCRFLALSFGLCASAALAADPLPTHKSHPEDYIHGAIAYSPSAGVDGMFWGADKSDEADADALKHCRDAARAANGAEAADCRVVAHFTEWRDARERESPRVHCGALAVSTASPAAFKAATATTGKAASEAALQACGPSVCALRQLVCT